MNSNYITTYGKDFAEKKLNYRKCLAQAQEFDDPLSESFRHYLKLGQSTYNAPIENGDNYLEKFRAAYPKLGKLHFSGPINTKMLERSFIMDTETIYQTDYCDKEKDREYGETLKEMTKINLDGNWLVPLTTQNASYRDAQLLDPNVLINRIEMIPPQHNIKNQERILKILGVKTGESEYSRAIGKLGLSIVKDHLHGKIYHPQF